MSRGPSTEMLIALAPAIACIVIPLLLHTLLR